MRIGDRFSQEKGLKPFRCGKDALGLKHEKNFMFVGADPNVSHLCPL